MPGNGNIICDAAGNPVAGYANTALGTTQPALVTAGSDYTATAKAQVPKVDAFGTQYVTSASPAGTASLIYTGQTPPATASQYGELGMMRQDTPTPIYVPQNADMLGSLNVHAKSKVTLRAIARQVATAANRYMIALVNSSSGTMVLRVYEVRVYVTPAGTSGSLLGSGGSTYYPLICELYKVSAANVSGGTAVTPMSVDSADTLASGVSVLSLPTVTSPLGSLFRADAVLANAVGVNFYERRDPNEKSLIVRPGEAIALICLSSGTVANASGGTTANAPIDMQLVFTQAPA